MTKACHHGSADFHELFIQSVNPIATVISSGDDEPHSHPRPDALGSFGKYGRGKRSLIFSTELARSAEESVRTPDMLQDEAEALLEVIHSGSPSHAGKAEARARVQEIIPRSERAVAVYGLISVRTNGENVIVTQMLERKRSSTGELLDIHRLEPAADGRLRYQSKH